MTLGERLALLRRHSGLRQVDLAEKLYVSPKTISKWENGYGLPDIRMLPQLASIFGTSTDFLLSGDAETERQYAAKAAAQPAPEEQAPPAKGIFRLHYRSVLHHRLTVPIVLCNAAMLALALFASPLAARNASAEGGFLYYSALRFLFRALCDGSPAGAAQAGAAAIGTVWSVLFPLFAALCLLCLVRAVQGKDGGGVLIASCQFGIAFATLTAAAVSALCINFSAGEVCLYPHWTAAVLAFAAFVHLFCHILVAKYGQPVRLLALCSAALALLLALGSALGCVLPRTVVPTRLDADSIEAIEWVVREAEDDEQAGADEYALHSRLVVRANVKLTELSMVGLTYRRTAAGGESAADDAYNMIVTSHRETVRRDGAYDNVFSVKLYLPKGEEETLSDFVYTFTVPSDPSQSVHTIRGLPAA